LPSFKELCRSEGFGPGEAVEQFMKAAVHSKSVKLALDGAIRLSEAQKTADIALLKSKLSSVRSLVDAGRVEMQTAIFPRTMVYTGGQVKREADAILNVLPRIEDPTIIKEALKHLDMASKYIAEETEHNARQPLF
jgi:hypothetical protein